MRRAPASVGFTLIEIAVALAILGVGIVTCLQIFGGSLRMQARASRETRAVLAARAQVEMLGTALDTFRLDVGRYPTSQEGLAALRQRPFGVDRWDGPYLKKDTPRDPWDRPYLYRAPGEGGHPYDLLSYGADGAPGGDGDNRDITSWEGDTG